MSPSSLDAAVNPYEAPVVPPPVTAPADRLRSRAGILLVATVVGFAVAIGLLALDVTGPATLLLVVMSLVSLVGAGFGLAALVSGATASAGSGAAVASAAILFGHAVMTCLGMATALLSSMAFSRGRQVRSLGRILLPPVEDGEAWAAGDGITLSEETLALDASTRCALADQWRENGRTEHASVAAFARLSLDLMALGAPPELVAASSRDALDEIRHAEQCFALARALDGRPASPGAFPAGARARTLSRIRTLALAELAIDSLIDGALHEGVSARIIARLAARAKDPSVRVLLKGIAADEGRHARHGWDVARWCLEEGGESVAHALEGALRTVPATMASPLTAEARDGGWEAWGIMGAPLEAEAFAATRADVVRRVHALVAELRCREPGARAA